MKRLLLLLLLLLVPVATVAAVPRDSVVRLTVVDESSRPLFGVHVLHEKLSRLLATTDLDGHCLLDAGAFRPGDSLQFQGVGFKTSTRAWGDIARDPVVVMKESVYELAEVIVSASAGRGSLLPAGELLRRAVKKFGKLPRGTLAYCNFFGKARYEKITEYARRVVEYRREQGYYFTSGDVTPVDEWDSRFCSYFLPARVARSCNLTGNGLDPLDPVYMTTDEARFDAGTRKVFTLLRAVQLHGPLFSGTRNYEITAVETNGTRYAYRFQTRPGAYPGRTRVTCRGTFSIDYERQEVDTIVFDYIDYQLYRQPLLGSRSRLNAPFSTRAVITLAYDDEGCGRVASCLQETRWKYDLSEEFVLVEQPSRLDPARGELVEREAFRCDDYRPVPRDYRDRETRARIHAVQRNPSGEYDSLFFSRLVPMLDDARAIADLSRVKPIEEQFREHSNKSYYPENHLRGFNGVVTRHDESFGEGIDRLRRQLFMIFPPPPAGE
ncbi:MAG: hypothetical protein LBF09_02600 [Odoribacteraceae bacterium]|jgi:hypothetical protein|nr:hypothetical protein [Odoribacteraceae bacterium]